MPSRLRVLVIGAGTMGTVHSRAYARLKDTELIGIVDPFNFNPDLARDLNVTPYHNLDDVPSSAFDVVDVAVPSHWHCQYVVEAASLKKSVFCEKPLALNLMDAESMIDAAASNQVRFSVGHCVRFFPDYIAAKSIVDQGQLGDIAVVRTFRGGPFPRGWNDWYANRDLSGGTLVDLMIHDFDFLRWVLGPVSQVYAKATHRDMNRIDFSLATLRFVSGAIAHVEGTWAHPQFGTRFEFAGSRGILTHDSFRENVIHASLRSEDRVALPQTEDTRSAYDLEIAHFIESILNDRPFRVTPEDALEALRIALAAESSARTGQPVDLDPSAHQGGVL